MNVLDLFSGIGGFTLGLASTGRFRTVAFCECEPFPRSVLAARWPGVPVYPDVRTLTADQLRADGIVRPDLVCGGFPCQDISAAGKGAGIDGLRSGLWREMARIIGEVRPRWVVVENSPSLRGRGGDRVLGDLESLGYACWPSVVGAVHAGAWHRRQRVWIVAYADGQPEREPGHEAKTERDSRNARVEPGWGSDGQFVGTATQSLADAPDADREQWRQQQRLGSRSGARAWDEPAGRSSAATDPHSAKLRDEPRWRGGACGTGAREPGDDGQGGDSTDSARARLEVVKSGESRNELASALGDAAHALRVGPQGDGLQQAGREGAGSATGSRAWPAEPRMVQLVHGLPDRLDRSAGLEAAEGFPWFPLSEEPDIPRTTRGVANRTERIAGLGNAVVPAVVAMIGRAILSVEDQL